MGGREAPTLSWRFSYRPKTPLPTPLALCLWRQKLTAIRALGYRGPLGLKPHTHGTVKCWPPCPVGHMAFPRRGPRQRSRAESPRVRVGPPRGSGTLHSPGAPGQAGTLGFTFLASFSGRRLTCACPSRVGVPHMSPHPGPQSPLVQRGIPGSAGSQRPAHVPLVCPGFSRLLSKAACLYSPLPPISPCSLGGGPAPVGVWGHTWPLSLLAPSVIHHTS